MKQRITIWEFKFRNVANHTQCMEWVVASWLPWQHLCFLILTFILVVSLWHELIIRANVQYIHQHLRHCGEKEATITPETDDNGLFQTGLCLLVYIPKINVLCMREKNPWKALSIKWYIKLIFSDFMEKSESGSPVIGNTKSLFLSIHPGMPIK